MKRPSRSDHYQAVICEIVCSDVVWDNFTNQHSIEYTLNPFKYDERYLILKDKLKEEFWLLAKKICTDHQWECLSMYAQGMTQMEIAKALNVNQSSITKAINGNTDYKNDNKTYGGVIKKLKKAIKNDENIQAILQEMNDLIEEKL